MRRASTPDFTIFEMNREKIVGLMEDLWLKPVFMIWETDWQKEEKSYSSKKSVKKLENFVVLKKFKKKFSKHKENNQKREKDFQGFCCKKKNILKPKMDSFTVLQKLPMKFI